MKKFIIYTSFSLLAASTAIADSNNKEHLESVDAAGHSVTADTSDKTTTNILGTKKSEHDLTIVHDPKGLGNKTTSKTHAEVSVTADGDKKAEIETKDRAGTKRTSTASEKTSGNWTDDGSTTVTNNKEVVDPKGLGNKQVMETKETVEHNADGSVAKRTLEKDVDGKKTVTESTH